MKKILIIVVLFAALGTTTTQAQNRQTPTVWGANDGTVYSDDRGEYRWEMRERRVWVPEYRTRGILGVGSRTIPGHYEMRTERVRVYNDDGKNNKKGHPHGMPPGQRKKMDKRDDDRYEGRDRRDDDRYEGRDRRDDDRNRRNNDRRDDDDDDRD
jgi:hypothetical protein